MLGNFEFPNASVEASHRTNRKTRRIAERGAGNKLPQNVIHPQMNKHPNGLFSRVNEHETKFSGYIRRSNDVVVNEVHAEALTSLEISEWSTVIARPLVIHRL